MTKNTENILYIINLGKTWLKIRDVPEADRNQQWLVQM